MRTRATLLFVGLLTLRLIAQQPPPPAFEAASIKPSDPKDDRGALNRFGPDGSYSMRNGTMTQILMDAYGLPADRILGAPGWFTTERYDIVARGSGRVGARSSLMLQSLLRDRFGFAGGLEMRDRPVYAMRVAKADGTLGPRLKPAAFDCANPDVVKNATRPSSDMPACGIRNSADRILAGGQPLQMLAAFIPHAAGRVVIDKTGLSGRYDLTLEWSNEPTPGDDRVSLFTAIQEQLGLRLEPDTAPLEVLVIKSIRKPTPD